MKKTIYLISDHDAFERWERDWVCSLLADFEIVHVHAPRRNVCMNPAILVISLSGRGTESQIGQWMGTFKEAGFKVGLIHLSDEWLNAPTPFYPLADFVFRNYYRPDVQKPGHGYYFGLGYKSGFRELLVPKAMGKRKHLWSFAGEVKTSRHAMLEAAMQIPGGRYHLTTQWDDPQGLDTQAYAALLSDTVFALCPRGNYSVDSFRVYEALEAGAIPIVEDDGSSHSPPPTSYWTLAYGPDFPCPRLDHWDSLRSLIDHIDIEPTAKAVATWWERYKLTLRRLMADMVERAFFQET